MKLRDKLSQKSKQTLLSSGSLALKSQMSNKNSLSAN